MNQEHESSGQARFGPSSLWLGLMGSVFREPEKVDLETFRAPGTLNNRLASWDPVSRNQRDYKTLLFNTAQAMPDRFFAIYSSLDTSVGRPVTVSLRGLSIDMDYLLAVHELLEFEAVIGHTKSICEIGAGFGRTCHVTLQTYGSQIDHYTIVDLAPCLVLSERYLKRVLSGDLFRKVRFVRETETASLEGHDLFINIDSMAEMDEPVARNYLAIIASRGRFFFTRNPVGKYSPAMVGITEYQPDELEAALSAGLMTNIVDIFNDAELSKARESFEVCMSPGATWKIRSSRPSVPCAYYQNCLYYQT